MNQNDPNGSMLGSIRGASSYTGRGRSDEYGSIDEKLLISTERGLIAGMIVGACIGIIINILTYDHVKIVCHGSRYEGAQVCFDGDPR